METEVKLISMIYASQHIFYLFFFCCYITSSNYIEISLYCHRDVTPLNPDNYRQPCNRAVFMYQTNCDLCCFQFWMRRNVNLEIVADI